MGLRGDSGGSRFRLKLSRPMIILIGLLIVIVIAIVAVALLLPPAGPPPAEEPQAMADNTPVPTETLPVVTEEPVPTIGGEPTAPPPTAVPATPKQVVVVPTAVATPVPAPTRGGAVGGVPPTTMATGGGEQGLPETSSGLPWLIPVGVVLLIAVIWWRLRRARSSG